MMSIGKKIKIIRGDLSLQKFADKLSRDGFTVYKGNIKKYEDEIILPSTQFYQSLVVAFNINLNWLLTGNGKMYIDNDRDIEKLKREVKDATTIKKKIKESVV